MLSLGINPFPSGFILRAGLSGPLESPQAQNPLTPFIPIKKMQINSDIRTLRLHYKIAVCSSRREAAQRTYA